MIRLTHAAVLILATSLAVPSAVAAETEVERKPPAGQQNPAAEHAPTNRMDKLVPPMTGDKAAAPASPAATNDKGTSAAHPPTGRVGSEVPQMKSDDAKKAEKDAAARSGANSGAAQKPVQQ